MSAHRLCKRGKSAHGRLNSDAQTCANTLLTQFFVITEPFKMFNATQRCVTTFKKSHSGAGLAERPAGAHGGAAAGRVGEGLRLQRLEVLLLLHQLRL